jgi:hypothetical protein
MFGGGARVPPAAEPSADDGGVAPSIPDPPASSSDALPSEPELRQP